MEAIIRQNEALRIANSIYQHSTLSVEKSIDKMGLIAKLQTKLMTGTAHFYFKKKDGSIREAFGTLLEKTIRPNIVGTGIERKYYGCQAYFDIEVLEWRSFRYENLISVED